MGFPEVYLAQGAHGEKKGWQITDLPAPLIFHCVTSRVISVQGVPMLYS